MLEWWEDIACHTFQSSKLPEIANIVDKRASHAKTSRQNVYHAFTKGVQHKLTFLSITTTDKKNTTKYRIALNDETDPQHHRPWSAICNRKFSFLPTSQQKRAEYPFTRRQEKQSAVVKSCYFSSRCCVY